MMGESVNLLLVDDRPENLLALEAILEPLGQLLIRANSGPEALKQVLASEFAAILLDVQMPGMNGFEVAEIIKSREKSRTIPIIFLSAISKEDAYVFKGYSMGAVDYVFKPFNPDVLRSKVAVFVDLFLKQREIQRQADLLRESQKRELELEHRTSLLEAEARSAAKLSQMNEELHRRQIALEQAMGARNRFYASMSHELRTPINAVIGYSTLMLDNIYGPLNAKQKEGLQRTLKAARHLLELVNDVLDLSKIEAGKIELSFAARDVPRADRGPIRDCPAPRRRVWLYSRPRHGERAFQHRERPSQGEADPPQSAIERDQVRRGQADPRRLHAMREQRCRNRGY